VLQDSALSQLRPLVSKPAQRVYLSTVLFLTTAFLLAGVAIAAYIILYLSYIPTRGFSRPVHLQFSPGGAHPYGTVLLSRELVSDQPYDVKVELHMPRTPENRGAGNFMLNLSLYGPDTRNGGVASTGDAILAERVALKQESRPAMLTYYSEPLEHLHKILQLPLYAIGWRYESETLQVSMMEGVEFARGWRNLPTIARLELSSERRLQVYSVKLTFTTRFRGLRYVLLAASFSSGARNTYADVSRYIMYKYWITSFLVFTSAFWMVEMTVALVAWAALSFYIFPAQSEPMKTETPELHVAPGATPIKTEPEDAMIDDTSDTSRIFPTFGRQPPLRYSSPRVKDEDEDEGVMPAYTPVAAGEAADDEDESDDFVLDATGVVTGGRADDSGIGTSLESSVERRDDLRRRRSGGFGGSSRGS